MRPHRGAALGIPVCPSREQAAPPRPLRRIALRSVLRGGKTIPPLHPSPASGRALCLLASGKPTVNNTHMSAEAYPPDGPPQISPRQGSQNFSAKAARVERAVQFSMTRPWWAMRPENFCARHAGGFAVPDPDRFGEPDVRPCHHTPVVVPPRTSGDTNMTYENANAYETIELFGLTEKDAELPIPPEDHILTDSVVRETFEALLGQLRGTGLETEIEPLAHGLATILQRRKIALGKELDRTADKIGALAKSHDGSEIAETALEEAQARFLQVREIVAAIEVMSEAAAECYEVETGHAFIPAAGSRASARAQETGAVFEARQLLEQHDRETAAKSKVEGGVPPLIVSGGATDWTDIDVIFSTLDKVRERIRQNRNQEIFLCHKGGKHGGAEMIAARWARARGVAQARFDPRWSAHGRAAPFKCNDEMLDDKFAATGVVLFGGNGGVALNLGRRPRRRGAHRHAGRRSGEEVGRRVNERGSPLGGPFVVFTSASKCDQADVSNSLDAAFRR